VLGPVHPHAPRGQRRGHLPDHHGQRVRRGEIGLRRALGATRRHIASQFLTESALLAAIGGIAGLALGAGATEIYCLTKNEPFVVALYALVAAPSAGFLIGALAGLYPAAKAARLSPTEALRA
jgi:putative ABC transport system permease protein